MESLVVDVYESRFWIFSLFVIASLSPISRGSTRRAALAALNLLFLAIYLQKRAPAVPAAVAVVWCALVAIERAPKLVSVFVSLGGAVVVLIVFLIHKLKPFGAESSYGGINPVLEFIGFSYVALRLIDLGRAVAERRRPAPDICSTINYLIPFHMLAAGPIQAYDEFVDQPDVPEPLGFADSLAAFERIVRGLFKKYVLAGAIQKIFLTQFRSSGPYFWLELQLNYLWLFLDFSAYSDIAVGLGRLTGVATPENFNKPYLARNVIDYWERWHISLSLFIRRNIFVPIQLSLMRATGGRRPLWIASFAFAVSFTLCGLWHNIGWNWFVWGAYHAAGLIVCNLYKHLLTKRLGRKGVERYLANRWIRAAAIVLVYEFVAISLIPVTASLKDWSR